MSNNDDTGYLDKGTYEDLGGKEKLPESDMPNLPGVRENKSQLGLIEDHEIKFSAPIISPSKLNKEESDIFESKINTGEIILSPVTMMVHMEDFQRMRKLVEQLLIGSNKVNLYFNNNIQHDLDIPVSSESYELQEILDKYEYMEHEGFEGPNDSDAVNPGYKFTVGLKVVDSIYGKGEIISIHTDFLDYSKSKLEVLLFKSGIVEYYDLNGQGSEDNNIIPYSVQEKEETKSIFGVGMMVEDSELGEGTICDLIKDQSFPIQVLFPDGRKEVYDFDGIAFRNGPTPDYSKNLIRIKLVTEKSSSIGMFTFKKDTKVKNAIGLKGKVTHVNFSRKLIYVVFENNIEATYDLHGQRIVQGKIVNSFIESI